MFVAAGAGVASQPRNLIVAGPGAQATIVEHYADIDVPDATVGGIAAAATLADAAALTDGATTSETPPNTGTLTNVVTRVEIDADARITHLKLQQERATAIHLAAIDAVQARGSVFASHSMSFGARLARNDIKTRFDGEGCGGER